MGKINSVRVNVERKYLFQWSGYSLDRKFREYVHKKLTDHGYRNLQGTFDTTQCFETQNIIVTYHPTKRDILFKVFKHDNPLIRRRKLLLKKFGG